MALAAASTPRATRALKDSRIVRTIQTTSPSRLGGGFLFTLWVWKNLNGRGGQVHVAPAPQSQKVPHPSLTSVGVFTSLASHHFKYTRSPRRNDFHCWNMESLLE